MADDDIAAKVLKVLQSSGKGLDTLCPGSTERFAASIVPAYQNLRAALDRIGADTLEAMQGPDHRTAAWGLLWDACNGLLAAFSLLQRGYATETLAVSRMVFERVACALVLFDNPDCVPRFKAGHFADLSTRAVGPAARVIQGFSVVYGLLSQLGTHVDRDNVGTSLIRVEKGDTSSHVHLAIGGKFPTESPEREAWPEVVAELCRIAEQILVPAPAQILFNRNRKRAAL